jgi:ATP-binding cassette subfamily B protein
MMLCAILFYLNGTMTLVNAILMLVCTFIVYGKLESAGMYSALLRVVDQSVDRCRKSSTRRSWTKRGGISGRKREHRGKNVSFSYDTRKIIDDVSFAIPNGPPPPSSAPRAEARPAHHLIARFWDVDSGTITLDAGTCATTRWIAF